MKLCVEAETCAALEGPLKVTMPTRAPCADSESSPTKSSISCVRSPWMSLTLAELSTTSTKSCADSQAVGAGTAVHPTARGSTGGSGSDGGGGEEGGKGG